MTTKKYVLALDQGTTSSRSVLFGRGGEIEGMVQREFEQIYPQPGWVEHDAREIWRTQLETSREVLRETGAALDEVAAIGVANQRETTVVWDRTTGDPVCHAIVWQDRRTAPFCRELKREGKEGEISSKTGLCLDPYFSGTKIRWILDHVEGARERAERGELAFGTIDSWLVWQLTEGKVHVTDPGNASRTLLFDIHTGEWDAALLDLFGIPSSMLPEVTASSGVAGMATVEGLAGLPIAGIAGDQQAALFGQACFEPGMAKNTYGTGCFLLMHTGREPAMSRNNLLTTVAWKIGDVTEYALEGSVFIGGAVVQWLRDELGIIASAPECDELAESVEDSGGVVFVPAFSGLGAPHWDPYARGTIFGMTRGTGKAELCRAALEAIAFQSSDVLACMEKDAGIGMKELRVDGGASRSGPLLQFQSDLARVQVVRPQTIETTALGAAYLAGLGTGFWESREEIATNWEEGARFEPEREDEDAARLRARWDRAVASVKEWGEGSEGR